MNRKLFTVTYGSKLYGTNTPTSDTDLKTVYLPSFKNTMLGIKAKTYKTRVDADGVLVPDEDSMPDNGTENEFFSLQTFIRDFVRGQTYAVEMAYAVLIQFDKESFYYDMAKTLIEKFANSDVYSMVGFAVKQTNDYVHRGERMNSAMNTRKVLVEAHNLNNDMFINNTVEPRLDTVLPNRETVLDFVARKAGLDIGSVTNNNKVLRTLELNGRQYSETTTIVHVVSQLDKLIRNYGDRSTAAANENVDFKSLSHAVRVYQQAIEILDHGTLTFPRPNAEYLLSIKSGKADLEEVKKTLKALDIEVQEKMLSSIIRKRTPELEDEADEFLLHLLTKFYGL